MAGGGGGGAEKENKWRGRCQSRANALPPVCSLSTHGGKRSAVSLGVSPRGGALIAVPWSPFSPDPLPSTPFPSRLSPRGPSWQRPRATPSGWLYY